MRGPRKVVGSNKLAIKILRWNTKFELKEFLSTR